jgi:hypothetical protein
MIFSGIRSQTFSKPITRSILVLFYIIISILIIQLMLPKKLLVQQRNFWTEQKHHSWIEPPSLCNGYEQKQNRVSSNKLVTTITAVTEHLWVPTRQHLKPLIGIIIPLPGLAWPFRICHSIFIVHSCVIVYALLDFNIDVPWFTFATGNFESHTIHYISLKTIVQINKSV